MKTALVIGAAGFVARHLAAALGRMPGTRVIGADIAPIPAGRYAGHHRVDSTDAGAVSRLISEERPQVIFHLVGLVRGSDEAIHVTNVGSARTILEAARRSSPDAAVVLVGSAAEYGSVPPDRQPVDETYPRAPAGVYGRAKVEVSSLAESAASTGQRVVVVRPFNVLGAGIPDTLVAGAIVRRLRDALAQSPPGAIRLGSTSGIRDFVAVEDVVTGMIAAAGRGAPGEAYNLCTGVGRRVGDVLEGIFRLTGRRVEVVNDPSLAEQAGVDVMVGNPDKAQRHLGWTPKVTFDESLRRTWEGSG